MNLRGRLRKTGIRCVPWKIWKGEIGLLPISAQTLFKRSGLSIDLWEITLTDEGYLFPGESLLEVIKSEKNLKRKQFGDTSENDESGDFPDDWTDEDYIYYEEQRKTNSSHY